MVRRLNLEMLREHFATPPPLTGTNFCSARQTVLSHKLCFRVRQTSLAYYKLTLYVICTDSNTAKIKYKTPRHNNNLHFLCLVPDHGPLGLTGFNISSTAINISWGLIPKKYQNGIITGYRVYFDDNIHHSGSITVPVSQRNVILEDLLSYSLYNISIAGLTRKGEGWNRTFVMIRTDAGGRCCDNSPSFTSTIHHYNHQYHHHQTTPIIAITIIIIITIIITIIIITTTNTIITII